MVKLEPLFLSQQDECLTTDLVQELSELKNVPKQFLENKGIIEVAKEFYF